MTDTLNSASPSNRVFTVKGQPWAELAHDMWQRRQAGKDIEWHNPHNLKACYFAGDDVTQVSMNAYQMFYGDNLLYAGTLFPSVREMADDVIAMGLEMLNAPDGAGGTITSGGTESILLAIRAALNWARATRPVPGTPEIVAPFSIHPAFNKAASLMGLKVIRTPLVNYRGDVEAVSAAITENTIMIAGSAHAYPLGHVDPITAYSELAQKHNLWLHVDACVGGFFLPFVSDLGHEVPPFDFVVPGVRSISADLHKYGYTARGASLVLLREEQLKQYHAFNFSEWPTGTFNTPTVTGSRPTGAVASAWAVMKYLGRGGYRDRVEKTLAAKEKMVEAVTSVEGVHLCGNPEGGLISFHGDEDLDMMAVRDGLTARGWHTGAVVAPPGFQMLLNYRSATIVEEFTADLTGVVSKVRTGQLSATGTDLAYGG